MNVKHRNIMLGIIAAIFMIPALTLTVSARVWTPKEFPNVQIKDSTRFVSDPENLMSAQARLEADRRLQSLRQRTTCEVEVAIVPSLGDMSIEDWAEELGELHGVGKKDKDNGVLVIISPDDHVARIHTGYGVEGALPDISANKIIQRDIVPNMREDDLDAAVLATVKSIDAVLSDPEVAEELKSSQTGESADTISTDLIWGLLGIVASIAFLFLLVLFIHDLRESHKRIGNYQKALMWRSHLSTYWWGCLISAGSAILFPLLALFLYRYYRTKPVKCDTCGAKMHRLGEEEDNALLSDSQDFEEQLKTVDYDVWECPECGTIERFPFNEKQLKYSRCPHCGTMAMALEGTTTVLPATYRSAGRGEKIYRCKYCGHEKRDSYTIPKKESVAPVVIGGLGRGGNGGGGFGGGSFGGGSFGGGGATGRW